MARHTAVLWNVERVFRDLSSPVKRALGGQSRKTWTAAHYARKIQSIGEVLRAACPDQPPALLMLIEVESGKVVADIVKAAGWKSLKDARVPGERLDGYDLALAYSTKLFELEGAPRSYNIQNRFTTRDILDVGLRTKAGRHPLRVVHNHWPSRKLGESEPLRLSAADYCSRVIERHLKFGPEEVMKANGAAALPARAKLESRWNTPVLVTGDFNDNPYDLSLTWLLSSTRNAAQVTGPSYMPTGRTKKDALAYLARYPRLYNPTWRLLTEPGPDGAPARGTIMFDDGWQLLDQVLCSRGLLLPGPGVRFVEGSLRVFGPRYAGAGARRVTMTNGGGRPLAFDPSTGVGVSDHLPLLWDLEVP